MYNKNSTTNIKLIFTLKNWIKIVGGFQDPEKKIEINQKFKLVGGKVLFKLNLSEFVIRLVSQHNVYSLSVV